MFSKTMRLCTLLSAALLLSACSQSVFTKFNQQDISVKEKFYLSSNNYRELISLYRESLKQKEEPAIRYKLAESYYSIGDSRSSQLYLEPLLTSKDKKANVQDALLLQIKNNLHSGDYRQAVENADNMLLSYPNNGEAYNLLGIAYAKLGDYKQAKDNFNKARSYFVDDVKVLNNLAMIDILQKNYAGAVDILLPQYTNGVKDNRLVHNLVFALVKKGDKKYALDIIEKENLSEAPEALVEELKSAKHISK
ncbi:tetratricopeptide repeat protein [Avibacterium sp. 20-129]|uniref:tetratricopeptide repeat protein n=1 Tax=Avibacterium sp. 20-129 TaxID=2911525 RepID=UPI00224760E6|nr:tetratricopeptide repeat protein [Avibacterium sp. 20-129]MCW9698093.1 tetratricopeptide repeat protein [Avibacterium sp. 20-129]